jgi:short-subunit dehydrogenase
MCCPPVPLRNNSCMLLVPDLHAYLAIVVPLLSSHPGIRCTNIAPGEVATDILDQRPVPPSAERRKLMLNPSDVGDMAVAVAKLPAVAHVTEIIMTGKTTVPQAVL